MNVWKDEYYLATYLMAKQGHKEERIKRILDVDEKTWKLWKRNRPALREALRKGKQEVKPPKPTHLMKSHEGRFADYVYKSLPPECQDLWDEIDEVWRYPGSVQAINKILEGQGKRMRQHLFLYALARHRFDMSTAMRMCAINRTTLQRWVTEEPEFREILEEIHEHKKNFFENALIRLVETGDTSAIIFANKTLNKDRGYGDVIKVEGQVQHQHEHHHLVSIEDLDLSLEVRRALMEAVRAKQAEQEKLTANTIEGKVN